MSATSKQSIAAAALAALAATPSCILIIDRSAAQCEGDGDCAAFPGTVCSEAQVCVEPSCATHQECVDRLGELHVCVQPSGVCKAMLSPQCQVVEGDYTAEGAILLGVVVPTGGENAAQGQSITNSVRLAQAEFQQIANGLPPAPGSSARRPLALIGCNDNSDGDTAVAASAHLVSLGVPAIIGAAFSGLTIRMATEVTIPGQTLLISPSSTSVAITDLDDQGLVWRTAPSDTFQALSITRYVPQIEQAVRTELGLMPADRVKLAILHKGDAYGSGLGRAVEQGLTLNGVPALDPSNTGSYLRFDYGDPDNPAAGPVRYTEAVQQAIGLAPHVLLILGTGESVIEVLGPIEAGWTEAAYRARHVLSDGGTIPQLWETVVGTDDALRRRITGTIPGTSNPRFLAFRGEFNTQFNDGTSPDVIGAAGAYDATYLLAYSATALGATPISGPALAEGLSKMVPPGQPVDVGTAAINSTLTLLAGGGAIDFNGASGPLDFDVSTGEAPSDIQIWCMPPGPGNAAQSAVASGLYLDAASGMLSGSIGPVCGF